MSRIVDLPAALPLQDHVFSLSALTSSAGRGLDGRRQVLSSENRVWQARLVFPMYDLASAQRADVVGDQLAGRKNVLRVPVLNAGTLTYGGNLPAFQAAAGASATDIAAGGLSFSDQTGFSDGSAFALPAPDPVTVRTGAPAGQSFVSVLGFIGRHARVGAFFSVSDFLYRIESNADGEIVFNPPLRTALAVGDEIEVSAPRVRMRLTSDDGWQPATEFQAWSQSFSVELEEVFDR